MLVSFAALGATGSIGSPPVQAETVFTPLSLPTIAGSAVEGEVLTEAHARWSSPPVSDSLQWQRCDTKGKSCQSISKANGSTYRLTAADVGSTIRVGESARNSAGAVTPDLSEPTAVVQGRESGGHGGGGSTGNGGNTGAGEQGGGGGGSRPGSTGQHHSSAELERLLARQLAPSGRTASLAALRRHGGLSMRFTLPEAGTLTVKWYLFSASGRAKSKPTLLATGRATLTAGKATTVGIRLTASGKSLLGHRRLRLLAHAAFALRGGATVSATKGFSLAQ